VSKVVHAALGVASGLAGFACLPYFFKARHEVLDDVQSGHLGAEPKWGPYPLAGFFGFLCLCAFYMALRFLRYALAAKPTD
jgi:drug/metabolite transporter (DMT)-like permease